MEAHGGDEMILSVATNQPFCQMSLSFPKGFENGDHMWTGHGYPLIEVHPLSLLPGTHCWVMLEYHWHQGIPEYELAFLAQSTFTECLTPCCVSQGFLLDRDSAQAGP